MGANQIAVYGPHCIIPTAVPKMRQAICRENIRLASVNRSYVLVTGLISAMPGYAYPLERALPISDREIFLGMAINNDYQESPIWDWAGELLRAA